MALLPGGGPIQVATTRVLVSRGVCPPVTGQPATGQPGTGHSPNGQEDIMNLSPVKWALHNNFQDTRHRPSIHRSLDRKY